MSALDDIIDLVRDRAGADFSFILSRRGRLVTRHAPENMPEEGRLDLVAAGETVLGSDRVALRTIPREAIVPYGGAAPVDVYVGARDAAIVCVVLATWSDRSEVSSAFELGFAELDKLIEQEVSKRKPESGRRRKTIAPAMMPPVLESSSGRSGGSRRPPPPAPSSTGGTRTKTLMPPGRGQRKTMLGIDAFSPTAAPVAAKASRSETPVPRAPGSSSGRGGRGRTQRPPPFSMGTPAREKPKAGAVNGAAEAALREAPLGRGTLPFIPGDNSPTQKVLRSLASFPRAQSGPDITLGEGRIGRATLIAIELEAAAPQITFGAAALGRETLAAIDASTVPQGKGSGSAPDIRITLASLPDLDQSELDPIDRRTLPFTEPAADTKRAFEEALKRRAAEPPDVRVRLSNLDWEVKAAVLEEAKPDLEEAARRARQKAEGATKRNSNIEAWHEALSEIVVEETKSGRKRPRVK